MLCGMAAPEMHACVCHRACLTAAGTWAYFATILTSLTFTLVPFISLVLGWHPVTFSRQVHRWREAGPSWHGAIVLSLHKGSSGVPPCARLFLATACARPRQLAAAAALAPRWSVCGAALKQARSTAVPLIEH